MHYTLNVVSGWVVWCWWEILHTLSSMSSLWVAVSCMLPALSYSPVLVCLLKSQKSVNDEMQDTQRE